MGKISKLIPKVGDRIQRWYSEGNPNNLNCHVVCILDEDEQIGYKVWQKRRQRWLYQWLAFWEWEEFDSWAAKAPKSSRRREDGQNEPSSG